MHQKTNQNKIVIVNLAVNYLTIGVCNAFASNFNSVALITGSIHAQGEELLDEVKVYRINKWVEQPAYRKLASYLLGCWNIWWILITRLRGYEVIYISIPPMAYLLNLLLPHRSSMLIWDVYPDVFKITGMKTSHWIYRAWARLNQLSFRKAYKVFTISEKMADLLEQYVYRDKIIIQPIWSVFQKNKKVSKSSNLFIQEHNLEGKFIVQYSGNIGLTHKVEVLITLAEKLQQHGHIIFQIIGRGPRKKILEKMVAEKDLPNCSFLPFQSDEMFPYSLSAADMGVVILDDIVSKGSVPSKSYNLMSYGIPSLYIASIDSQLKAYADKYQHAGCFPEKEIDKAAAFILKLSNDKALYYEMSQNAESASKDFRRDNADELVFKYFQNNNSHKAEVDLVRINSLFD